MPINMPEPLKILEIRQETPTVKSFRFRSPTIAGEAQPGQFLMLWPITYKDEIPIAVSTVHRAKSEFEVSVTNVGDCSAAIHSKEVGDEVAVRGPYGNGFNLRGHSLLLVLGGYGAAPLRFAAEEAVRLGKKVTVLMGAGTAAELLHIDRFDDLNCEVRVATKDGSSGYKGYSSDLLPGLLDEKEFDSILVCGAESRLYNVLVEAQRRGIPAQFSVERFMKCAVGVCGSCDCGGIRICKDGPVVDGATLLKTEFGRWKRDKTGRRVSVKHGRVTTLQLPKLNPIATPELGIEIAGVKFNNTVMNASGSGFSSTLLHRYAAAGAGAVVTKSTGPEERKGYSGPNFIEEAPGTWNNAMGLPNPGIINYDIEVVELSQALQNSGVRILFSIFGKTPEELEKIAARAISYGGDVIEINASCPHTEVSSIEADADVLKEITAGVVRVARPMAVPVIVKISPNVDYIEAAKAAVEGGAAGIVATNTLRVRPFDQRLAVNILGNPTGYGGRSGRKLAEVSKQVLIELHNEIDVPIFNAGGITPQNIVERALLGASAFQMATALIDYTPEQLFERCKTALKDYIIKNGYSNIKEIIGTGLR